MKYDAALDVSTSKFTVCVLNREDGAVVLETTVETDATAILAVLQPYVGRLHLVDHEAGGMSPWLHRELQALGLPMVLLETRHAAAALKAQRNKQIIDLLSLGRGPAFRLRINCIGPAHRPSVQCRIGVPIKLEPMSPIKFGCDESFGLEHGAAMGSQRNCIGLANRRPSCCGQAVSELLSSESSRPRRTPLRGIEPR